MQIGLNKPVTDWTDQTLGERLLVSAEALFLHDLIDAKQREQILGEIRERLALADRARIHAELCLADAA